MLYMYFTVSQALNKYIINLILYVIQKKLKQKKKIIKKNSNLKKKTSNFKHKFKYHQVIRQYIDNIDIIYFSFNLNSK